MAKTTIYILNGPNMNLLGTREPEIYGRATLADVEKLCRDDRQSGTASTSTSGSRTTRASSSTGFRRRARRRQRGVIINPAGYTTTSVAIHGCDLAVNLKLPVIEVHITNIHAREKFPASFLHFEGGKGGDLRLRHRGLRAGDQRPCRLLGQGKRAEGANAMAKIAEKQSVDRTN